VPAVRRAVALGFLIRMPMFVTGVLVTLHIVTMLGRSYTQAGIAAAVLLAAIAIGGALAGLGGAYVSIATVLQWTEGMTAGAGWIALALVVFSGWRALGVLAGAWLFGGITVLQLRLQAAGVAVPVQLLSMAPYLVTIVALVLISARRRGSAAPGSLGQIFHTTS